MCRGEDSPDGPHPLGSVSLVRRLVVDELGEGLVLKHIF